MEAGGRMDYAGFVAVHRLRAPSVPAEVRRRAGSDAVLADALIGYELACRWGEILHRLLSDGSRPSYDEHVSLLDDEYAPWANRWYSELLVSIWAYREAVSAYLASAPATGGRPAPPPELLAETQRLTGLLDLLRFHVSQRFFQAGWMGTLFPERFGRRGTERFFPGMAARTRLSMARQGVDLVELREAAASLEARGIDEARELRRATNGVLAELDTGVMLAESIARYPQDRIAALPAPPQFEQFAGPANADFLLIDVRSRRVRGIQVKSTVRAVQKRDIDADRISLLSVAEDLQSYAVPPGVQRAGERVPWPGVLALRALTVGTYVTALASHMSRKEFEAYKSRATELLPDSIPEASRRLVVIAESAERERRATPARPPRPVSAKVAWRRFKQRERARFDQIVSLAYARALEDLAAPEGRVPRS
ncbi:hypothetical protein GCM10010921_08700 [Microbacterium album]|uniref:Uncharacterized protein n=2 Tax=Microbacterium album TaxID=2053191 RepID=A0A917IDJ0_9MICO|nr:hypothetical protein GCM10010921_08700 [Microbacterium album]